MIEQVSLLNLQKHLDTLLGKGEWPFVELETVLTSVDFPVTHLLLDKINVLRIINTNPELIYEDPVLFLYVSSVTNNTVTDFNSIPYINMLESAYSLISIDELLAYLGKTSEKSEGFKKSIAYLLRQEGLSSPIPPFSFLTDSDLEKGQTEEDTKNKQQAIDLYLTAMKEESSGNID